MLLGRQQQLEQQMKENRQAQEESLQRREELIKELELEKQKTHREREEEGELRTARKQEIAAQVHTRRGWGNDSGPFYIGYPY